MTTPTTIDLKKVPDLDPATASGVQCLSLSL